MVAISITIEGQDGLTWPRWKRLITEVEALGFANLYCSDHFTNDEPPDQDALDMVVALTYLADHSQRLGFGSLVAPLSFRHPTLLVRQAAALDDLSGGRMILGIGAGWQEREHHVFGHYLGDVPTRLKRLEEGLEVITRLLRSDEPVTYEGQFYQLRGATLLPRPQRPAGPPIMIGGSGMKRTLPLVARYANIWNGIFLTPEDFRERSARLDTLLNEAGRQPGSVKRTLMCPLYFFPTLDAFDQWRRNEDDYADKLLDEVAETLRNEWWHPLVGTPEMVIEQIRAYTDVGVEEVIVPWGSDSDDMEELRVFAERVLPAL